VVSAECPECLPASVKNDVGHDSVYLHSGEFYLYEVDLEIPGRGFNWRFERKYRSGIFFDGPLGHNWEFNYNRRLFVEPDGSVLRMDGYGRADRYELTGGGYISPTGFYTGLVRNTDGTFTERDRNGTKVFYSRPDANGIARMTELRDRNGNRMRFEYNAQGQLIRVIDTLGRPIVYRYNANRRLIEVEDFTGRKIRFEYDRNGDLVAVTSPAVVGTPNGNDFPAGKTTRYTYSSRFADERLNHNLLTITAPNEVAAGGPPRVVVEYETNPASPHVDRVLRQTIGGVNKSGIPAGGTISYEYRTLGTAAPSDFNTAVFQNTVTDRNGNRTEYRFNQLGNIVRIREFMNRNIREWDPEFFETRYEYNKEGELLRQINPEGNRVEYVYDDQNTDRFQQGNLVSETRRPDSGRGGDQTAIRITYSYEPIYNQVRTVTEARGNDPTYVPQNGGANSPERYTTVYIFDYQEGTNFAALARELGVTESAVRTLLQRANVPMGLGDVNGDGRTDQIAGNVVKVIRPTVNLLPDSQMARIERGTRQPIEETYTYNRFGQMTSRRDPEGNVTFYTYYPENDPDGDGRDLTPGVSSEPFGYLKEEIRDAVSSPERNSGTNPRPAEIRRQYFYDRVGNVIGELDGRGILTEYVVNQLNQVVQIIRAADVSEARRNAEEPNWAGCNDQTLIECSRGMVAFAYRTNIFYDHNNNVVKREIENRDSNNQELAGDWITYTMSYDILDNLIEERQEVSENPREILVTRYRYDRNENRVLEISPMAVGAATSFEETSLGNRIKQMVASLFRSLKDGLSMTLAFVSNEQGARGWGSGIRTNNWLLATDYWLLSNGSRLLTTSSPPQLAGPQPSNVVSYVYDERDLLFTSTRGGLTDQFRGLEAHADIPELNSIPNSADMSTFTRVYDGNRNLIALIDGADNTGDGRPEVTTYLYDGFDRQVSVIDAIGNQSFTQYDPTGNVVRVSNFGPVGGKSPTSNAAATFTQPLTLQSFRQPLLSQVEYKYDELSRIFERNDKLFAYSGVTYVRTPILQDGPLGRANDGWVTTRYEYDRNSRRTFLIEDDLSVFQTQYDGVDRVIRETDPEENEVRYSYDDNNNVTKVVEVEITQREDVRAGKVPDLRETFTTLNIYDSLNRLIRTTDNIGQTTRYHYDSRDNFIFMSDAQHSEDPADLIPDPLGLFPAPAQASRNNPGARGVAKNTHRRGAETAEKSPITSASSASLAVKSGLVRENLSNPRPSVFSNAANRHSAKIAKKTASDLAPQIRQSGIGVSAPSAVDLEPIRENPIHPRSSAAHSFRTRINTDTTDQRGFIETAASHSSSPATRINRPGNTMEYFYDGINRKIAEVRHLRVDGQGKNPTDTSNPANPDGLIVIDYDWDANSRLVAMADDGSLPGDQNTSIGVIEATHPKGNVTRYVYDDLNRLAREIFDDQTCNVYTYDADDNLARMIDENGSIIRNTYDGISRLVRKDVTRATSATPHPAGCFKEPGIEWQVIGTTLQEFEYDGLSRITRSFDNNEPDDTQDDATVTYAYDSLSRLLEEVQNGHAVSSRWMGDNNRTGLIYPNGRELEITFDKLDRIDRINDNGPRTMRNRPIVDYDYIGPGRVLERTYSNGVRLTYLDDARQRQIGYDGLRRVVLHRHLRQDNSLVAGFAYDYDRANNKLFEIKQHDNNRREDYTYDSIYRLVRFARQGEPEDTWQLDGANNWASRQDMPNQANNMNEYTSFAGIPQLHDDNGNLIDDGTNRYQYDFANRLRRVIRKSDDAEIAIYRYDAHNRRNERIVTNTTSFDDRVRYLYDGWREIEEQRAGSTQQYVYGVWIDEPLTLDKDINNDGVIDQTFFYQQDAKTYVAALTNRTGGVVDRVTYDAYGQPSLTQAFTSNPYLFTGRRYDPEAGMLYYRARYHQPGVGRFIHRDPIGTWADWLNAGNAYTYVANNPLTLVDPLGLGACEEWSDCYSAARKLPKDQCLKRLEECRQKYQGKCYRETALVGNESKWQMYYYGLSNVTCDPNPPPGGYISTCPPAETGGALGGFVRGLGWSLKVAGHVVTLGGYGEWSELREEWKGPKWVADVTYTAWITAAVAGTALALLVTSGAGGKGTIIVLKRQLGQYPMIGIEAVKKSGEIRTIIKLAYSYQYGGPYLGIGSIGHMKTFLHIYLFKTTILLPSGAIEIPHTWLLMGAVGLKEIMK